MSYYDYRWAAGASVALALLANVEDDLYPYTKPRRIPPRSQPIDPFPVETALASGGGRGDGFINHEWQQTIPVAALNYALTKFSLVSAVTGNVTIYTREHDREQYGRYTGLIWRPSSANGRLEYLRQGVVSVTWKFTKLVRL